MPRGRLRRSTYSRHAAPVLLVVHWLRRAVQRFLSDSGNKYSIRAASRDAVCAHVKRTIYAHLPEIRSSMQWRTDASEHTRALWQLIDDNVLVAWSRDVKFSSPTPTLQQLIEQRHQMLSSLAYARLVQATARELMSELFKYSV
eukprot:13451-Heterococcus_DN1.PRE.5